MICGRMLVMLVARQTIIWVSMCRLGNLMGCLQIDNNDVATLNYKHVAPVNGRTVYDVARELLAKTR